MPEVPDFGVRQEHTYWSNVMTSGIVDVEWKARHEAPDELPSGLRVMLKHIDKHDMAWIYRHDTGVLMVPAWVLEPYER